MRVGVFEASQPDELELFPGALASLRRGYGLLAQRELDVLRDEDVLMGEDDA